MNWGSWHSVTLKKINRIQQRPSTVFWISESRGDPTYVCSWAACSTGLINSSVLQGWSIKKGWPSRGCSWHTDTERRSQMSFKEEDDNKSDGCIFPGFTCREIVFRGLFWSRSLKFGWTELHTSSNDRLLPSDMVTHEEEDSKNITECILLQLHVFFRWKQWEPQINIWAE